MEVRFILDGVTVENPKNWSDAELKWEFDTQDRIFTRKFETDFEFYSDGYDILRADWLLGVCRKIDVSVIHRCSDGLFAELFGGTIYTGDITFNLESCSASCQITDDSYNSLIKNSKRQKFLLNGTKSKDGSDITVNKTNVEFHVVATGGHDAVNTRTCYKVFDAFTYLVEAMTNSSVNFISDFFDVGGTCEGLFLTTGTEIRLDDDTTAPEVSYDDLFIELNKKLNIAQALEIINGVPTIRIEPYDYFFQEVEQNSFNNVPFILQSVEQEQFYSRVLLGGKDPLLFDDSSPNTLFPDIRFLGWKDESYYTVEDCNVDNELDLKNRVFIIDSNNIENQFNGNDDEDKEIFLVAATLSGTWKTDADDFLSIGDFYYNQKINNANSVINWLGAIPIDIAKAVGNGQDTFEAQTGADFPFTLTAGIPVTLSDQNYTVVVSDPNSNYDGIDTYTAPATGSYVFQVITALNLTWSDATAGEVALVVQIEVNGSIVATLSPGLIALPPSPFPASRAVSITVDTGVFLTIGDTVDVNLIITNTGAGLGNIAGVLRNGLSSFAALTAVTGGGTFQTYDPKEVPLIKYQFEFPLTVAQFEDLTSLAKYRNFIRVNSTEKGWIRNLSCPITTGRCNFTLITTKNLLDAG